MRIVHVTGYFIEGMSYQENLLPAGQAALGHEVFVLTGTKDPDFGFNSSTRNHAVGSFQSRGFIIQRISQWIEIGNRGPILKGLYNAIQKMNPDILFIHDVGTSLLTGIFYKLMNPGVTLQMDCHSDEINARTSVFGPFYHGVFKQVFRIFGSRINNYFAVEPSVITFMKKYYGIAEDQIMLLPLPGDNSILSSAAEIRERVRRNRGINGHHRVLVHTGKMPKLKETLSVLKMFHRLRGDEYRLWLIGDIEAHFEPVLKEFLSADSRIEYLGWMDAEKLREVFVACDLLVSPGSLSHSFVDAICAGAPVVLDETAQGRYLTQWGNGLTVRRGSVDDLLSAVSRALIPDEARKMRDAAIVAGEWLDYRNVGRLSLPAVHSATPHVGI